MFMADNNKPGKNDGQEHMPFCRGHCILRPWVLPHSQIMLSSMVKERITNS